MVTGLSMTIENKYIINQHVMLSACSKAHSTECCVALRGGVLFIFLQ
jgi:hypothetical protein